MVYYNKMQNCAFTSLPEEKAKNLKTLIVAEF